ncbi:conserved Plasmodium protein, unknown function [Plasmodium knowlesi strain H]|uniref:Uncharacterized protein n=3 Tax=Plasmodium knowlesi TaxID=5850 RepID=A0A5K1VGC6_PLAKH|nr:conserved protein, unknown function [Plasmodium knowlesi strain H]OTN65894.1 Uncharacterized protein PKNOH_S100049600 [Plasmodium knowlesi]CAA9987856.1 conserved protein, unknown function [Plasmodium knowlesi strain H]SBO22313.1 conserved Plasmodium protein, unknown function [Plasmodium knowlesi strain H]SBO28789.1 conserved Plasmodium protein, unknown function [Plasmodium knowlesi strain H]VVS77330.1 conserved protein, unknown function [Plasmodium knowlesi strain H]|eukprot:XP_002258854.1 hypothetical protein, conserved in Plasmodium species [Plasmodium knowlesi strain H]
MANAELVDAGCFITQMNELLLIDPLYINCTMTNYCNSYISGKEKLLPRERLNGIYFKNAKPGLWSSFAIRENNQACLKKTSNQETETDAENRNNNNSYNNVRNEMVLSFICFNNTEYMHEYLTVEKVDKLKWEKVKPNESHLRVGQADQYNSTVNIEYKNEKTGIFHHNKNELLPLENYFTNVLTIESGQVGLFCMESIKHSADLLFQKHEMNNISNKEELDNLFNQNMNDLYPWFEKICNLTLSSSVAVVDFIDMPIGCVCLSSSDCVVNYLCEVVRDEVTDEVWAIRVNFLSPLK